MNNGTTTETPPLSDDHSSASGDQAESLGSRPVIFRSEELLRGRNEAWIEHGDQMYRLRLTSAGKLYLTK